ncbi:MAG: LamG-like jellyroll fold domain-containing protein [Chthoniobacteraceae bacterium]
MKPALLLLALATPLVAADPLKSALLLHASFDRGPHADFATGDTQLYTSPDRKRTPAQPGLHAGDAIEIAKGDGRFGDALNFRRKTKEQVFFKGERNLGFQPKNWSGSASFWMRLDPDKDLEPGYCDPVQFLAQAWGEGNMFVEFSKDHTPRHFRYAIMAITKLWNPNNQKWEEMQRRPMVAVEKPPFTRERWTHVCFTFGNANTGAKDGWGRLYLDGAKVGEFSGWENTFNWEVDKSALTLGLAYVGLLDDLAVFNRPLTDDEVKTVFALKRGIAELRQ